MMAFVLMVILMFGFAVDPTRGRLADVFPGILWMSFLFSGMLGIGRTFAREQPEETLSGLILAPGDRMAIFAAKLTASFLFMLGMEVVSSPVFFVLFNEPWNGQWALYGLTLSLGALGFVGVGTLLSAISVNVRAGDMLFPVLVVPLELPVLITAVQATTAILAAPPGNPWLWLKGLIAYDVIFTALPLLVYEYLWEV